MRPESNKIGRINPGDEGLSFYAKVIEIDEYASSGLLKCVIGDETGIVDAMLPAASFIVEGSEIFITGVSSEVTNRHIMLVTTSDSILK